jgi:hypothetical protein
MIIVTDKQGNKHQLEGRLERIVLAVIENAGEIVKSTNTKIEFNCAGSALSATIQKSLEMPRPEA